LITSLLHSIDVASSSSSSAAEVGSVSIAIKLSGLLSSPAVFERVSAAIVPREHFSLPPAPAPPAGVGGGSLSVPLAALDAADASALKELWEALRGVARHAREKKVRLLIDAEYSWYQPAIDALYEALACEFNSLSDQQASQPLLFNTYQVSVSAQPSTLFPPLIVASLPTDVPQTHAFPPRGIA
jgi:proline dehydrogenase